VLVPDEALDLIRRGDENRAGGVRKAAILVADDDFHFAAGE